jgi:hypothetical protein
MPTHHNLDRYLEEYIRAAGIAQDRKGPLFRTTRGRSGEMTGNSLLQSDVWRMIRRRALAAGIKTEIGCHTFRATGITAYLKNGGRLEIAQQMAAHESARTTGLYDRRNCRAAVKSRTGASLFSIIVRDLTAVAIKRTPGFNCCKIGRQAEIRDLSVARQHGWRTRAGSVYRDSPDHRSNLPDSERMTGNAKVGMKSTGCRQPGERRVYLFHWATKRIAPMPVATVAWLMPGGVFLESFCNPSGTIARRRNWKIVPMS